MKEPTGTDDAARYARRRRPLGLVLMASVAALFTLAASAQQISGTLSGAAGADIRALRDARGLSARGTSSLGTVNFDQIIRDQRAQFDAARDTYHQLLADLSGTIGPSLGPLVAYSDLYTTSEDTPLTVGAPGVLANDTNRTGGTLSAQLVSGPASGSLSLKTDGSFDYTPQAQFSGIDSFRYQLSSGGTLSNIATVAIRVDPVDSGPIAMADLGTTPEDTPVTLDVLANDQDPDNDPLTITGVTQPANGVAAITASDAISYTPRTNFFGTDRFTYTVSDGRGSSSATVTVQVTPVNDPPVVQDIVTSTASNTPVTIDALARALDPDNDPLRVSAFTQPANGTVTLDTSKLVYTPRAGFAGTDTFTFTVTDVSGESATARVTVSVVGTANSPPAAVDDAVTTAEDTALDIDVLANDSDPDGDTLAISAVTQPANGNAVIAGSRITYSPAADFSGSDTFTYTVSDGRSGMASATVSVQVTAVNDAPLAADDSFRTLRNSADMKLDVLANDTDPDAGDTLQVSAVGATDSGGSVIVDGTTGDVLYTPAREFVGAESFTYTVADASGATATATATITVVPPSKVDLRLLIISTGTAAEDARLDYIDGVLNEMRVPYDVLDSSRRTLTPDMLFSGEDGFYNGIILTDTELFIPSGGSGFTLEEWRTLHEYERNFDVRESVLAGFPATNAALDLDYGMTNLANGSFFLGRWLAPAGGPELFEYVNAASPLPITDYAITGEAVLYYTGQPRNTGTGPDVQPLLVAEGANGNPDPAQVLVSMLHYPDGREVLLSTIANAWFLIHSQVLAYEFINFATKGVFVGGRHVYLEAHVDDLLIEDDLWIPARNVTDPAFTYRMSAADLTNAVAAQNAFRNTFPLVGQFKLDFPFNGEGAMRGEPLTEAVIANMNAFRFINHTFSHLDMDVSAGTTYQQARDEIAMNRQVWADLGLPGRVENEVVLVSGDHSGLRDDRNTDLDRSDDIEYPDGANAAFLTAVQDLGIRYLASDSSQINQNVEAFVPGYDILLLPRWPTAVFYNVTTPEELTDEYNYIFHERYLELGQDPCAIPGAICTPRSYPQILAAEAETALRHMLSYRPWPHYFHQSNLYAYNAQGATLQFDWLNAVLDVYASLMSLPVLSPPYYEIGRRTEERLIADQADVSGEWDLITNQVRVWAGAPVTTPSSSVNVLVTGIGGGAADYGGQSIQSVPVGQVPQGYPVDRALNR